MRLVAVQGLPRSGSSTPALSAQKIRVWFPMAIHMLEGLATGMRNSQAVVGQRERLLSLGRLAAGLTHELNNPASAAVRATASLRERVSKMRGKLSHLASADIDGREFAAMVDLQEAAVERMAKITRELSPMETSEAEDELGDWLEDHDVRRQLGRRPRARGRRGRRRLAGGAGRQRLGPRS